MESQAQIANSFIQFQFLMAFLLPLFAIIAIIAIVVIAVQQVNIAKRLKQILIELEKKNNI